MNSLPLVKVEKIFHNGKAIMAVCFNYNSQFYDIIRRLPSSRWSKTRKSWYLEDTKNNLDLIHRLFYGIATIDDSAYVSNKDSFNTNRKSTLGISLSKDHKSLLNQFYAYLKGKRYSQSTITTYVFSVADFIAYHKSKAISTLDNRDVELFIETVYIKRNYSVSTQRQFISALKLFTVFEPSTQIDNLELVRPAKSKKLPRVLSQEEVITLIARSKNIKHRIIIALLYSAGIRISELLSLKIEHINIERRQIFIKNSKGRKDRYVSLADSILPLLHNYYMTYQPKLYVIEGASGAMYSSSSVRKFLNKYALQSQITIRVTPHTLRHSYATHLIENGVGLRQVQELLGHSKPETTMIYTHVARKDLLAIRSPLDHAIEQLNRSNNKEQKFLLSGK